MLCLHVALRGLYIPLAKMTAFYRKIPPKYREGNVNSGFPLLSLATKHLGYFAVPLMYCSMHGWHTILHLILLNHQDLFAVI